MRPVCLVFLATLFACDESGSFTVVVPGDDPALDTVVGDDEDTDGADPSETDDPSTTDSDDPTVDPPAVSANNCGTYAAPEPGQITGPVYTLAGATTLTETSGFGFEWDWDGCEAERHFDAGGNFLCETVWDVTGSLRGGFEWGQPTFVFDLVFTVDEQTSTCEDASDARWAYGFDLEWDLSAFQLKRAPGNSNNWQDLAAAPFQANDAFSEIEMSYLTGFLED
jgi:hypothetical protein